MRVLPRLLRPTDGPRLAAPLLAWLALAFPAGLAAQATPADSARRLARSGHVADALAYGEAAARSAPWDPLAQLAFAIGAMAARRYDRALRAADSALALAPGLPAVQRVAGQAYLSHAREHPSLGALKRVKAGRAALERAIALDPGDLEARRTLMQFLLQAPGIVGGDRRLAALEAEEIARRDGVQGLVARIEVADAERKTPEVAALFARALALVHGPADSTGELGPDLYQVARRLHDRRQRRELSDRVGDRLGR